MLNTVTKYLLISAMKYPDYPALVDSKITLTYQMTLEEAEKIALEWHERGLFKKPIAVMMEKGARTVAAFLGVALSGNYYTVIDTKMPQSRIEKILETFEPSAILTDRKNIRKAQELNRDYLVYEDLISRSISEENKAAVLAAENKIIDTDILYVLFTSGSTGIPKGVIITHRSVIDYTEWVAETFHFDHTTVIGNQAPFYFDNSVLDIYSAIRNGAPCYSADAL